MNNLQHVTIMAVEELTINDNDYIPSDQIASKVMKRVQADLGQVQEALNFLYSEGYLSGTKTGYQLTQKGFFYTNTYEIINERVNDHVNSKFSNHIPCLWISVGLLALVVFGLWLALLR